MSVLSNWQQLTCESVLTDKIFIRVDASIEIGSGHVMRCLTLADELKSKHDVNVTFICRDFNRHLGDMIRQRGYTLTLLHNIDDSYMPEENDPSHAKWLGVSWQQDSNETIKHESLVTMAEPSISEPI